MLYTCDLGCPFVLLFIVFFSVMWLWNVCNVLLHHHKTLISRSWGPSSYPFRVRPNKNFKPTLQGVFHYCNSWWQWLVLHRAQRMLLSLGTQTLCLRFLTPSRRCICSSWSSVFLLVRTSKLTAMPRPFTGPDGGCSPWRNKRIP